MIELSIIIVCYKGWDRLTKCLDGVNSFTGETLSTEVIIVDNMSDDGMIAKIEKQFPKFRYIHNNINGGYANGCNLGGKQAEGDFIMFLNPDTVASESEIEKLFYIAKKNPDFSVLSCRQVNEKGKECIVSGAFPDFCNLTGFQRALLGGRKQDSGNKKSEFDFPDWVSGSVILTRKELFQKLNGLDEDFWMYFEDVDLCKRVWDINGKVVLCRDVIIEHNHGGSSRINLKTTAVTKTEVHISRHLYISKHKTGFNRFIIQTFLVINNLISGGIMALTGLIFFFVPKLFSRTLIYIRLLGYYKRTVFTSSWISTRSVNFHKTKTYARTVHI
jgi:GT2 family glycosyltransferase